MRTRWVQRGEGRASLREQALVLQQGMAAKGRDGCKCSAGAGVSSCSLRARGLHKAAGLSLLPPWQPAPNTCPWPLTSLRARARGATHPWNCTGRAAQSPAPCRSRRCCTRCSAPRRGRRAHRRRRRCPRTPASAPAAASATAAGRGIGERGAGQGIGGGSTAQKDAACCQYRVQAWVEAGTPRLAPRLASPQLAHHRWQASRNAGGTTAAPSLTGMECRSRYVFSPFTTTYTLQAGGGQGRATMSG